MKTIRVWILRLAALAALLTSGVLYYSAYNHLTWSQRTIAAVGELAFRPGRIQDELLSEGRDHNQIGFVSLQFASLFLIAGIIAEGVGAILSSHRARDENSTL